MEWLTISTLRIFVDESGDFGAYDPNSPYYIIVLVLHDQSHDISECIDDLTRGFEPFNQQGFVVHTAPIIRREGAFHEYNIEERRRILNRFIRFVRNCDIYYYPLVIMKKHISDSTSLHDLIKKALSRFINEHLAYLNAFEHTNIYYDNGQGELTHLLFDCFSFSITNLAFRRIKPESYHLFQVADLFCTLTLIELKAVAKSLSSSELLFFGSERDMRKNYLKPLHKKRLH